MCGLCCLFVILLIVTHGKSISAVLFSFGCGCESVGVCAGGFLYSWMLCLLLWGKRPKKTVALWLILFLKDVHDYLHSVLHHLQSLQSSWGQCDFAMSLWHPDPQRPDLLLGTREGAQVQMHRHHPVLHGRLGDLQAEHQVPAAWEAAGWRRVPDHPTCSAGRCWHVRLQSGGPRMVQWLQSQHTPSCGGR